MIAHQTSLKSAPRDWGDAVADCDWRTFAAGALVATLLLSKRSTLLTVGAIAAGGFLCHRAISRGHISSLANFIRQTINDKPAPRPIPPVSLSARVSSGVDEASMESFPASDPPARY